MTFQLKIIVFLVASAGICYVSRASLQDPRSHGFYRFFAWEAILALILLNLDYWFNQPFSIRQIFSWTLLIVATGLVIHGAHLLRTMGKPDRTREDATLIGIEKTTELVTAGAYRYVRHPIYSSLLLLTWGVLFKHLSWVSVSVAAIATLFLVMTAKVEEAENICFFGEAYRSYMKQTWMFVPFVL
ncbi:MAG TPA: isoprenylcysteine carboxylmethyltransferase family protein [Candidatus Deferrimicrobium sp.]|nr:isoprenylcysteine carboxylmethyltransferase family protein [Candidatus Deferrimicrobium sp.]